MRAPGCSAARLPFALAAAATSQVINPPAKNKRNHWVGDVRPGARSGLRTRGAMSAQLVARVDRLAERTPRDADCTGRSRQPPFFAD